MAKGPQTEFKFRKTDTIGAASAEHDREFLPTCFVITDEYEALKNKEDIRQIVLGRTGSGKSALFERLKEELPDRVITIEPDELALTYISNSQIIRFFSDLGVNLDPFYKLLWRHVLTVEVLRKHFESHANDEEGRWWDFLSNMFPAQTHEGKEAKQAVQYLRQWGEEFWVETEYRVKEITTTMENKLRDQIGLEIKPKFLQAGMSSIADSSLSEQEKAEVVNRGQHVVSETQVQDLSKVRRLLESLLTDRQKNYYLIIDRLDENWVEERLRYRLIMALLDSIKEIGRLSNVKVLVAVRRDLIDRVFTSQRGDGFQEEKYESLYLTVQWSSDQIMQLLDKRISNLVDRRYQKRPQVTHHDLLPKKVHNVPIVKFITERAQRPRDVISFFNNCIVAADGKPKLNVSELKDAEGQYSQQRLRALADEWNADYPELLYFVEVLKRRPQSFSLKQVEHNKIADLCLKLVIEPPRESGILTEQARSVVETFIDEEDFKRKLFMVFYRIGLVGLKLETFERASWIGESGQSVSASEINNRTGVMVHATYWRALGIKE